jgi:hypothetical protein
MVGTNAVHRCTGCYCIRRVRLLQVPLSDGEPNPHPAARCPYCGQTKAVVTWRFCSIWCMDHSTTKPRKLWAIPDAPEGNEDPGLEY